MPVREVRRIIMLPVGLLLLSLSLPKVQGWLYYMVVVYAVCRSTERLRNHDGWHGRLKLGGIEKACKYLHTERKS